MEPSPTLKQGRMQPQVGQIAMLGATGFVGGAVQRYLEARGTRFACVEVRSWFEGWVRSSKSMEEGSRQLFEQVEGRHAVILLATGVDGRPMSAADVWFNEHGRPMLAGLCDLAGALSVTMVGSCFEFGHRSGATLIESNAPENPGDTYGASLLEGSRRFLADGGTVPRKYLRLFQVFGKQERNSRLFPSLRNGLWQRGEVTLRTPHAIRDFCFIDDVAAKVVEIAQSERHVGKINVCSGVGMSVRNFAELCAGALAVPDDERSRLLKFGSEIHQYPYLVGEPFDDHCQTSPVDLHTLSTALA